MHFPHLAKRMVSNFNGIMVMKEFFLSDFELGNFLVKSRLEFRYSHFLERVGGENMMKRRRQLSLGSKWDTQQMWEQSPALVDLALFNADKTNVVQLCSSRRLSSFVIERERSRSSKHGEQIPRENREVKQWSKNSVTTTVQISRKNFKHVRPARITSSGEIIAVWQSVTVSLHWGIINKYARTTGWGKINETLDEQDIFSHTKPFELRSEHSYKHWM